MAETQPNCADVDTASSGKHQWRILWGRMSSPAIVGQITTVYADEVEYDFGPKGLDTEKPIPGMPRPTVVCFKTDGEIVALYNLNAIDRVHRTHPGSVDVLVWRQAAATRVEDADLSQRVINMCAGLGITTLAELCEHTEYDLRCRRGIGNTSIHEIRRKLRLRSLHLKGDPAPNA